ncbi:DGCR14 [Lepeophtheirus salmonis]|uniref:DGCR14 n=2 Tax=Lepeophtheirus salmonis TaxID=72036 RepID=A0A7R8H0C8_LEPSM|nr:DGCR14 [Lepeophtheirus salmonis]CAF2781983.1 DGCR14 [Lepeophtheirus salmonis]
MTSPAIDPSESPLMTWGKVDSTPLRIDEGSSSPYINGGGQFKIQKVPERDQIAHELTEKNAKFYRDKKQKAIKKACRNMKSPSASLRIASMSPAAQRLATSKLGIRLGTDKSTSSTSRTPTPSPRSKNPSTPLKNVISNSIRTKSTTPISQNLTDGLLNLSSEQKTPCSNTSSESLTDNLLNIQKMNRSKASDFF